jgi:hypothetical protein
VRDAQRLARIVEGWRNLAVGGLLTEEKLLNEAVRGFGKAVWVLPSFWRKMGGRVSNFSDRLPIQKF